MKKKVLDFLKLPRMWETVRGNSGKRRKAEIRRSHSYNGAEKVERIGKSRERSSAQHGEGKRLLLDRAVGGSFQRIIFQFHWFSLQLYQAYVSLDKCKHYFNVRLKLLICIIKWNDHAPLCMGSTLNNRIWRKFCLNLMLYQVESLHIRKKEANFTGVTLLMCAINQSIEAFNLP